MLWRELSGWVSTFLIIQKKRKKKINRKETEIYPPSLIFVYRVIISKSTHSTHSAVPKPWNNCGKINFGSITLAEWAEWVWVSRNFNLLTQDLSWLEQFFWPGSPTKNYLLKNPYSNRVLEKNLSAFSLTTTTKEEFIPLVNQAILLKYLPHHPSS